MTKLLIDADILIYKALTSVEKEVEWEEDVWTLSTDLKEAREAFEEGLSSVLRNSPTKKYIMCFSDSDNFRKTINPSYKNNRSGKRKPMGFKPFKERIVEEYSGVIKPTLEADDVVGILATKPKSDFIIYSLDKDLMTIPGKHFVDGDVITVSEDEADLFFFTQVLTGDTADGYPGCPGIGPKKAEKILDTDDMWSAIVETYVKAGLTEEDAILQARMARILRWDDWDTKQQQVRLWTPSS